ncbi:hypothetical protein QA641_33510 [Bradyrhizobium sp. CB1650]|uniref:hypothetical protein n=1 Tax=Bradyrhizobium sp. CB1650 TaxID=3039153 RepID=UPI002435BCB4|nr:hypothetical protein [Bradyrhizobium sp. CB1650]WGD50472.1 hypothetical protein QA641_33510 [Bradyrhizobium sp. CB1650]
MIGSCANGAFDCAIEPLRQIARPFNAVTFTIFELPEVELFEIMEAGIMFGLNVEIDRDGTTLSFDSSYGVRGRIKAKRVAVSFEPRPAG